MPYTLYIYIHICTYCGSLISYKTVEHEYCRYRAVKYIIAAAGLREGEAIFAFLDDTYVVSAPERTGELHASRALLLSQAGPFASRALNLLPTR